MSSPDAKIYADQGPGSRPIMPWWRTGPQPNMYPCEVDEINGIGTEYSVFPLSNLGFPGVPVYISGTTAQGYPKIKECTFATIDQFFGWSIKPGENKQTIDVVNSGVIWRPVSESLVISAGMKLQLEELAGANNVVGDVRPVEDLYKSIEVDTTAGVSQDADVTLPESISTLVAAYLFDPADAADEYTELAVVAYGSGPPIGTGNIALKDADTVVPGDAIGAGTVKLILWTTTTTARSTKQIGIALESGVKRTGANRGQYQKIKVLLTPP